MSEAYVQRKDAIHTGSGPDRSETKCAQDRPNDNTWREEDEAARNVEDGLLRVLHHPADDVHGNDLPLDCPDGITDCGTALYEETLSISRQVRSVNGYDHVASILSDVLDESVHVSSDLLEVDPRQRFGHFRNSVAYEMLSIFPGLLQIDVAGRVVDLVRSVFEETASVLCGGFQVDRRELALRV